MWKWMERERKKWNKIGWQTNYKKNKYFYLFLSIALFVWSDEIGYKIFSPFISIKFAEKLIRPISPLFLLLFLSGQIADRW